MVTDSWPVLPMHAGLPLMNKKVYQREQEVAAMRDAQYSGSGDKFTVKDAARDSRLQRGH